MWFFCCHNARVNAYYADHFVLPLPAGHRFPMAKYALLRQQLAAAGLGIRFFEAPAASAGELALAHHPHYIEAVETGQLSVAQQREIGFPWTPAMVERSRRSVGATVAAARDAMAAQGVAANLAGGTHHAYAHKGTGFCVFNDVAVAARLMQAEWTRQHAGRGQKPLRVAVVDLDVHQGNGTASIFQHDSSVFTLSLHGEKNFPFRKEASDLDIELPDGCTDTAYLEALEGALQTLQDRFEPQLVFYIAGADAHEGDRLGRLKLTDDGMQARDLRVLDWAWQRRVPVVISMGGGYGHDIARTVAVQVNTYRVASAYWSRWQRWHNAHSSTQQTLSI
jgi:acetoin utilization deacetylase AcuC-like enzyme